MKGIYLFKLDEKNLEDVLQLEKIDFVWVASEDKKLAGTL